MKTQPQSRPAGVTAIATLFFFGAAACVVTAAFTSAGVWPLALGRYVVSDLVTLGPAVFAIAALIYVGVGVGLLWLKNWARCLAIVVAVVGLYFMIGPISSALVDLRFTAMAVNGAQIILRVVVLWYLLQQGVAEVFEPTHPSG